MNYTLLLVAGVAAYAVGWIWYGWLFRRSWMHLSGVTPGRAGNMGGNMGMGLGFVVTLVRVYVLALFVDAFSVFDLAAACELTFWIWLGFLMVSDIAVVLYEGKSWKLFFINTSHSFVSTFAAAAVLAYWR